MTAAAADRHRRALDRDSTGDSAAPIFDFVLAVDRIRAARRAIDASGRAIVLTGRSEGFLVGRTDLRKPFAA